MKKAELLSKISQEAGVSKKDVEGVMKALFETITSELAKGETVSFLGFGSFSAVHKSARQSKNPMTGEPISIDAKVAPKFKAGKALKDALNGAKA